MSEQHQQEATNGTRGGSILAAISNEMVGLYKDYFGRGPTKAKTNCDGVTRRRLPPSTHG
jgi:hypothetical protein